MKKHGCVLMILAFGLSLSNVEAQDLVHSIVKAGITPDGDVAGAPTDFLINLDVPFDNSDGLSLPAGKTVKIVLPPEFVDGGTLPTVTAFSSKTCTPGALQCNTSAFIQGWPQRPILPVVPPVTGTSENTEGNPVYNLTLEKAGEGSNTFVHTAVLDVGPGSAPPGPGIKQIHMILPSFQNPTAPGDYEIQVIAETGPGGSEQTGSAVLTIRPETAPSINLTTVYDPMRRNSVHQDVLPGGEIVPYDFWVWDGNGQPMLDVEIVDNKLMQGDQEVGEVTISAPDGATGQSLVSTGPSTPVNEVFFGRETARLTTQFTAGDMLGKYVTRIEMVDGNSQQLTVNVVPEPSAMALLVPLAVVGLFLRRRQ